MSPSSGSFSLLEQLADFGEQFTYVCGFLAEERSRIQMNIRREKRQRRRYVARVTSMPSARAPLSLHPVFTNLEAFRTLSFSVYMEAS